MKIWTVQSKETLDIINQDESYLPDFNKSMYLNQLPDLKDLYSFVLESYNQVNNVNIPGLIFGFAKTDNLNVSEISNFDEFKDLITRKKDAIESLWNQFSNQNSIILELEYAEPFNPMLIDLNDFQFLMPPIGLFPPYKKDDIYRLLNAFESGKIQQSIFPSEIIQTHSLFIKKENVVNTYDFFTI